MTVYAPLQSFLARTAAPIVTLNYNDIERVLGRPLPPSAKGDHRRQWWANTDTHSQAKAWLRAGRKATLDFKRDQVTFSKQDIVSTVVAGDLVVRIDALKPTALRMLEDIAEENGLDLGAAMAVLINQAAKARREATLDWFAAHTTPSSATSVDLIREDRDAR